MITNFHPHLHKHLIIVAYNSVIKWMLMDATPIDCKLKFMSVLFWTSASDVTSGGCFKSANITASDRPSRESSCIMGSCGALPEPCFGSTEPNSRKTRRSRQPHLSMHHWPIVALACTSPMSSRFVYNWGR